jgi:hypothetical protein
MKLRQTVTSLASTSLAASPTAQSGDLRVGTTGGGVLLMKVFRSLAVAFAIVSLSTVAQTARADSQTFIQAIQVNPNDKPWVFTNNGVSPATFSVGNLATPSTTGELVLLTVSTLVNGGATPTFLLAYETAKLTAASGATASASGFDQPVLAGEIKYTDTLTGKIILDVKVNTSSLKGQSSSGALSGSKAPNVVTFSSQVFAPINTLTEQNYSISLSSIFPAPTSTKNGYLKSFVASGSGTFAGAPVPEPGTLALAFSALPVLGFTYLRRRRSQA